MGRCPGRDLDDAAGRIASEQRALRTLEHRDLRDIDELAQAIALLRQIDAVDVKGDGIFDHIARGADPADKGLCGPRRRTNVQARDDRIQLHGGIDAAGDHRVAGHRCYRDRDALQILASLLGRYDNFLQPAVTLRRFLR